jgi:hypothetical protein
MQNDSNRVRHSNYHNESDEIAALKDRLTVHRRNLQVLEKQRAQYGSLDVPLRIINAIAEEEKAIAQIEARMAGLSAGESQSPQKSPAANLSKKMWLPRVWWVPIIVALIGLAGVIITSDWVTPPPPVTSFDYQVRVQAKDTGEYILNAKVTIEVGGQAPLDGITDSNGLARIFVGSSHAGKPGLLIVEATGYKRHTQNMDLTVGTLPDIVQLEPAP